MKISVTEMIEMQEGYAEQIAYWKKASDQNFAGANVINKRLSETLSLLKSAQDHIHDLELELVELKGTATDQEAEELAHMRQVGYPGFTK